VKNFQPSEEPIENEQQIIASGVSFVLIGWIKEIRHSVYHSDLRVSQLVFNLRKKGFTFETVWYVP
jgi:hypothetical protein